MGDARDDRWVTRPPIHRRVRPRSATRSCPSREAEQPLPAVVWIHGGGWRLQDQTACPDLVQHFAEHGYVMVSIDYRLVPETRHLGPAQR
ncbi:alpha/beta hydrolase fold domain-containing protein [Rhodococcus sp. IEGM 1351]|uniref:alpha/beta hydrolase fold domain-containing protein n=1 Tax=Rhodococcus sp. IEGM 1351 TaxID=3047089 RepID=UPI0032D59D7F